jgi:hypothetical protein
MVRLENLVDEWSAFLPHHVAREGIKFAHTERLVFHAQWVGKSTLKGPLEAPLV